jgi:hypothetical protein
MGFPTYGRMSSWPSQVKVGLTDMQTLHSMVNIGITLVQITRDLCTLYCESEIRQRRVQVGSRNPLRNPLTFPQSAHLCMRRWTLNKTLTRV